MFHSLTFGMHASTLPYLAVLPFWALFQALAWTTIATAAACGIMLRSPNRQPWLASSLMDFWGSRWNRWIRDWLWEVMFLPMRKRPQTGLFLVFFASAVLHEVVISLPAWLGTTMNVWGQPSAYFAIQWVAVVAERRFLRGYPRVRRGIAAIAILAPVPLLFNEATLYAFGLGPTSF